MFTTTTEKKEEQEKEYNILEKRKIYDEYFSEDNIIKKPLKGLPRFNSPVDEDIEKSRRLMFEVLKLKDEEVIRLALGRAGDCTCKSVIADKQDLIHLRDLLNEVYPPT